MQHLYKEIRVKSKRFVVEPPTLTCIGFEWYVEGDDNHNATVKVFFRKKGENIWKEALPLLRIQNEESIFKFLNNRIDFIGSDPQNPHDLGGEVEYWMEDEKYILNKSCLIWTPKGLRHCPLRVTKVERPILFLAISMSKKYVKDGIIHAD